MTYNVTALTNNRAKMIVSQSQTDQRELADMLADAYVKQGHVARIWEGGFGNAKVLAEYRPQGYRLHAERECCEDQVIGDFPNVDEAAAEIDRRETIFSAWEEAAYADLGADDDLPEPPADAWPEGFLAVLTAPDGRRYLYADGWEPMDEPAVAVAA